MSLVHDMPDCDPYNQNDMRKASQMRPRGARSMAFSLRGVLRQCHGYLILSQIMYGGCRNLPVW